MLGGERSFLGWRGWGIGVSGGLGFSGDKGDSIWSLLGDGDRIGFLFFILDRKDDRIWEIGWMIDI